jgi:hypothetical protein
VRGENMKNARREIIAGMLLAIFLMSCNNFFHELIPPDGDRIFSFQVPGQVGGAAISDSTVTVTVAHGTDIHSLLPYIEISQGASIIPVTLDYVSAAFPQADLAREALGLYMTNDLSAYVSDLIRRNPGFNVPAIDMPIDFSASVNFFVISGQGTMRQYTVNVFEETNEPRLLGMAFSKYDNPQLVKDALCMINQADRWIIVSATYPAEMTGLSYALVPSFEILGDKLEIDGVEIQSRQGTIQFSTSLGVQSKTITVTRNGISVDYYLAISFAEDPDTVRSITDFRFTVADNPSIAATSVASIVNNDSTGTITLQVFYSGAQPVTLVPRFVTPGTVSVSGAPQSSGSGSRDFSSPTEYRVVSRNGQYTRTYTVQVEFVSLTENAPRILSFSFSQNLNPDLLQDTSGEIGGDLIMIDVHYKSQSAPETLIPEFTAQGIVTVMGSVQVSGASGQDFSRRIKYTVTNPLNPMLTRDYWVQARLLRNASSDATITAFGFYPEENPGLAEAVIGRIDQSTGKISVYAPLGSGITSRTMVPRFTSAGQVSIGGAVQSSGSTGLVFDRPITYTVVSANGQNRRDYIVTVRELKSTIYVNQNARGYNDGTSWADAFTSLKDACEAAALFPDDVPKEIWIARGTYKPSSTGNSNEYFLLAANTSYIGGSAGTETARSQRNAAANTVVIFGDLGGGRYSNQLFAPAFNGTAAIAINGDLSFEDLAFTDAKANLSGDRGNGAAISAVLSTGAELTISRCSFNRFEASGNGGAIYVRNGGTVIADTSLQNLRAEIYGGAISLAGSGSSSLVNVSIDTASSGVTTSVSVPNYIGGGVYSEQSLSVRDCTITNISGDGIRIGPPNNGASARLTVDGLVLRNIADGSGLIKQVGGDVSLLRINASSIIRNAISLTAAANVEIGNAHIQDCNLNGIYISGIESGSTVAIKNSNFTNVFSALMSFSSKNFVLEDVTIEYTGEYVNRIISIYGNSGGLTRISNCRIVTNVTTDRYPAIGIWGGDIELNGVTIDNLNAPAGPGVEIQGRNAAISNCNINNTRGPWRYSVFYNPSTNEDLYTTGGGAGFILECDTATISNTVITNARVDTPSDYSVTVPFYGYGGGINWENTKSLTIRDSRIENCTATYGGAIYPTSGFTNINTVFINCSP